MALPQTNPSQQGIPTALPTRIASVHTVHGISNVKLPPKKRRPLLDPAFKKPKQHTRHLCGALGGLFPLSEIEEAASELKKVKESNADFWMNDLTDMQRSFVLQDGDVVCGMWVFPLIPTFFSDQNDAHFLIQHTHYSVTNHSGPEYEWFRITELDVAPFFNLLCDGSMASWLRLYSHTHGYCTITQSAAHSRSVCVPPEQRGTLLDFMSGQPAEWVHVKDWTEVVSHGGYNLFDMHITLFNS
jgi:hypothetical protein